VFIGFVLVSFLDHPYLVIYAAIYALSIWVLIRRRREKYVWHMISSTMLFALASLQVGLLIPIFDLTLQAGMTILDMDLDIPSFASPGSPFNPAQTAQILSSALDMSILLSL
jgi:hypothetical protein